MDDNKNNITNEEINAEIAEFDRKSAFQQAQTDAVIEEIKSAISAFAPGIESKVIVGAAPMPVLTNEQKLKIIEDRKKYEEEAAKLREERRLKKLKEREEMLVNIKQNIPDELKKLDKWVVVRLTPKQEIGFVYDIRAQKSISHIEESTGTSFEEAYQYLIDKNYDLLGLINYDLPFFTIRMMNILSDREPMKEALNILKHTKGTYAEKSFLTDEISIFGAMPESGSYTKFAHVVKSSQKTIFIGIEDYAKKYNRLLVQHVFVLTGDILNGCQKQLAEFTSEEINNIVDVAKLKFARIKKKS
jgi:hypothetical protein